MTIWKIGVELLLVDVIRNKIRCFKYLRPSITGFSVVPCVLDDIMLSSATTGYDMLIIIYLVIVAIDQKLFRKIL